ncbi:MAG: hypothetical protein P8X98_12800 [Woeseiaceae bacterium]
MHAWRGSVSKDRPFLYRNAVRLLLYNIRYAVGGGASMHMPIPGAGYVLGNQAVLPEITTFIKSVDPDVVGLIEVDTGSIRSRNINQAERIAADLGMNTSYETKYGSNSFNKMLPIVRKQGNAFMAAPRVHGERFHYLDMLMENKVDRKRGHIVSESEHLKVETDEHVAWLTLDRPEKRNIMGTLFFKELSEYFPQVRFSDHLPLVCDFEPA